MTHFNLVQDEDGLSLILTYNDGSTTTFPESHPKFSEIKDHVLSSLDGEELDEDFIKRTGDIALQAGRNLSYVSERVRMSNGSLFFDGDLVDNTLADHIIRLLESSDDGWRAFVNFLEKVYTNPSVESRDALYTWLSGRFQAGRLTITQDGDFIAYKGTQRRADGTPESVFEGTAIVNGQVVEGHIPNAVGSIIEMPRSNVDSDNTNGCSTGLHAGTWDYATGWARESGFMLTVKINPRDVVSVPSDSSFQKLRVSRYEVLSTTDKPIEEPTYYLEDDYDEDGDEYGFTDYEDEYTCESCGEAEGDVRFRSPYLLDMCYDCYQSYLEEDEDKNEDDDLR